MYPGVGRATVELLERLGCTVVVPPAQTCCGQMHINAGYPGQAAPLVANHVRAFEGCDLVVAPSGSCVACVRHQHAPLAAARLGEEMAQRASDLARRTFELSELLVDVLGVEDVGAHFPHRVTYHPSCHAARLLGVGDRPLRLLRAVRGIDLVELPDAESCCGFGGTFSLKNADVSSAMLTDKLHHVLSTGAEHVTAADSSCLMHMGGGLSRNRSGVTPIHLAEILAATEAR